MDADLEDSRPQYVRVADDLRGGVRRGEYVAGQKLPAARELARQYGIAVMTVTQALRLLRDEGVVIMQQGRGTFVREQATNRERLTPTCQEQLDDLRLIVDKLDERLTQLESHNDHYSHAKDAGP